MPLLHHLVFVSLTLILSGSHSLSFTSSDLNFIVNICDSVGGGIFILLLKCSIYLFVYFQYITQSLSPKLTLTIIIIIIIIILWGGTKSLGTAAISGLLYKPQMIDEDDCGAIGGMKIGRGDRSTRRKPALAPLCPSQIPHDQTRVRTPGRRGGKPATNRLSYGAAHTQF
jgi:hypothetical protein